MPDQYGRRGILAAGATAVLARPWIARAATRLRLKLATAAGTNSAIVIRATEAAKRIEQESGGQITITLFPNSQLGTEPDVLNQLRAGAVDLFSVSTIILSTLVPQASISGVGFAFDSYDQVWRAMDGGLGASVRERLERVNLYGFERIWSFGFRQMTSGGRSIRVPDDLAGFKIRVPSGPLWSSIFQALRASPTTVQISELYSALRTGLVDGTDLPMQAMDDFKIHEVQKHVFLTSHMWDGPWMLANKRSWDRIGAPERQLIEKHLNQAGVDQRADVEGFDAGYSRRVQALGLTVTEVDRGLFRSRLKATSFYADWKATFGGDVWREMEKYTGAIA